MVGSAVVGAVLVALMMALVRFGVPWRVPRPDRAARSAALAELPADQVARGRTLHRELRPVRYAGMGVELVVVLVLGVTPAGAGIVAAVGRVTGDHRLVTAVAGGLAVAAVTWLVSLPFAARRRAVLRRYGLVTQSWPGWLVDLAKGAGLGVLVGGAVLAAFFALTGALPGTWWLPVAAGGTALTVLFSLVMPVLVEPVFNRFVPMGDSPLRGDLLALAAADGVPVRDVLVADASRRTRAVNAYVSGLGPTRRIVVYDTLLEAAPDDEVRLVVAHELGHAKHRDVVFGTALGALGAALGACVLRLLDGSGLPAVAGADGFADPRSTGLLLAVATVARLLAGPAGNLVSRRIEARADDHALRRTGAADTFAAMQRRLSTRNLADVDPHPVEQALFGSHPSTVDRIAAAHRYDRPPTRDGRS